MEKFLLVAALMLLVPAAYGEYYRYEDASGNIVYTDDLTKVPAPSREGVERYEAAKPDPAQKVPAKTGVAPEKDDAEKLSAERSDLGAEADLLRREKERIEAMAKDLRTEEKQRAYNDAVVAYNEKVADFVVRRDAYNAKVAAYNAADPPPETKGEAPLP